MNRIAVLASALCLALALVVAIGGVRVGRKLAAEASAKSAAHPATAASRAKPAATPTGDDALVIRFARNPQPVPPFLVNDLNGNVISTAALKGKVLLIVFWATWCGPCRAEIPDLIKLHSAYPDELEIIGVSTDEDPPEAIRAFAREAGINYPIVMVSREIEREFGGVPALPTTFVVNKDGGVVGKHVGLFAREVYDQEVRALLGLPIEARVETFEDTGQIFLKNAANATELPGVSLKGLSATEKAAALHRMNAESCNCGCGLTIAQCRINDTACNISRGLAAQIVKEVAGGKAPAGAKTAPATVN